MTQLAHDNEEGHKVERAEEPAVVKRLRRFAELDADTRASDIIGVEIEEVTAFVAWLDRHPSLPGPTTYGHFAEALDAALKLPTLDEARVHVAIAETDRIVRSLGGSLKTYDTCFAYAFREVERAWMERALGKAEPPPAAPIPSVQGEGKAVEASERQRELEDIVQKMHSILDDKEEQNNRLRHSVTEQQGEIARLREELGKTKRLSASEEYRALREAHADRDAYRRECNNLRCELAKAKERNAELEHFKRQHEVECPRRETIRRLEEDNARLQKELRDERERNISTKHAICTHGRAYRDGKTQTDWCPDCGAIKYGEDPVYSWLRPCRERAQELPYCAIPARTLPPCDMPWGHAGDTHGNAGDGFTAQDYDDEHHRRQLVRFGHQPPTASGKESEDKCAKCAGSGRMWDNGDKCACDDCNGTGKTAAVESGAEVAPVEDEDEDETKCSNCGGTLGDSMACEDHGYRPPPCQNCCAIGTSYAYCAKRPCPCACHKKPVPQASAAEQPTPLTNEQAQGLQGAAPAPVGGGDAAPHLRRALALLDRPLVEDVNGMFVRDAVRCVVAHLEEHLTGEHDARKGKANG